MKPKRIAEAIAIGLEFREISTSKHGNKWLVVPDIHLRKVKSKDIVRAWRKGWIVRRNDGQYELTGKALKKLHR